MQNISFQDTQVEHNEGNKQKRTYQAKENAKPRTAIFIQQSALTMMRSTSETIDMLKMKPNKAELRSQIQENLGNEIF